MMNKKLVLQLLVVSAFAGTQINADWMDDASKAPDPASEMAYYLAQLGETISEKAVITNLNVSLGVYIGLAGSNFSHPLGIGQTFNLPTSSCEYLIYPSNSTTGVALLVTVNSPTSIDVQKCVVRNGQIMQGISLSTKTTFTNSNGKIYICRNASMNNGTIYTDATKATAITVEIW